MKEPGIHTVVIKSSAQIGKSEIELNGIGYFTDQEPSPMLMLQPTLNMAEAFSKDRVAPMFRDTPVLTGKVRDPKARDSGNTLLHKKFPGGHLTLCGANSPASLASRPIRVVFADEIDRYPVSAGTEGDPLQLAIKRTATFHNRLIVMASTPTVKGASRIEMAFETSDQRRYYVPCPHCGTMQPLVWSNIKWDKGEDGHWDNSDPWYECDHCEEKLTEGDKTKMLRSGRWMAEGFSNGIAGFHINELYSPWRRWGEIVEDFLAAKEDSALLRVWTNTSMGETYEEYGKQMDPDSLIMRKEAYPAEVPAGAAVLVAGVDTQDNRLEVTILGVGEREEKWVIDHRVIWGDPGSLAVWNDLDDVLLKGTYRHESGANLGISATCIDSGGHHTQMVYKYCRGKKAKRIFAIKGVGGFGRPATKASSRQRIGRERSSVELWALGVDELKALVAVRLEKDKPGPGYIHFPLSDVFDDEYFAQLTAEKLVTKFRKGVPYQEWICTRKRNEAIDCMVYAHGALILLNPKIDALAARLVPADKGEGDDTARPAKSKRSRKSGYMNRWK